RRVTPKVFLIGESAIGPGMEKYLEFIGTKWRPDVRLSCGEQIVEFMGRLCYRSWEPGMNPNIKKVREGNEKYLGNILKQKHGSVFEHPVTHWVFADVSRVFTHELVRHRAGCAYSQESLRYVRLEDLGLWLPPEIEADPVVKDMFEKAFEDLEDLQKRMAVVLQIDGKPFGEKKKLTSAMRRVAPIGLATAIGASFNFRTLRHIIEMRTAEGAEAEIRFVIGEVARIAKDRWPSAFQDLIKGDSGEWQLEFSKV
ncbi:MAG: FAD-dependent thymidylate synthase, partial [Nitrospiria bacterium]